MNSEQLKHALADGTPQSRRQTLQAVRKSEDETLIPALMESAQSLPRGDRRLVVQTVIQLATTGDPAPWVVEMFYSNGWRLRKKEAQLLARFAGIEAVPLFADSTVKMVWEGQDGIQIDVMQAAVHAIYARLPKE